MGLNFKLKIEDVRYEIYINLIILQEYIFILVGLNFKLKIEDVRYEILHEFNRSTRINFYFGGNKFQVKS